MAVVQRPPRTDAERVIHEATMGLGVEADAERADARRGLILAAPAFAYLLILFVIPLGIVFVYSFATRGTSGTELSDWNFDSYLKFGEPLVWRIILRSFTLAAITTVICLVVGYPFCYYLATRSERIRNLLLVLVMIPFWTNFLVRNFAWRVIFTRDGPLSRVTEAIGLGETDLLFTQTAVVIGMVYGFLPFMILPLYASIERVDKRLLEASRDLYANGFRSFIHVLLPLSMPGVIAGSILVFVPSLGAYVTPEILGGAKSTLLGSYIVRQFLNARDFPHGSAISFVLMIVMLIATIIYFRKGGRTL